MFTWDMGFCYSLTASTLINIFLHFFHLLYFFIIIIMDLSIYNICTNERKRFFFEYFFYLVLFYPHKCKLHVFAKCTLNNRLIFIQLLIMKCLCISRRNNGNSHEICSRLRDIAIFDVHNMYVLIKYVKYSDFNI